MVLWSVFDDDRGIGKSCVSVFKQNNFHFQKNLLLWWRRAFRSSRSPKSLPLRSKPTDSTPRTRHPPRFVSFVFLFTFRVRCRSVIAYPIIYQLLNYRTRISSLTGMRYNFQTERKPLQKMSLVWQITFNRYFDYFEARNLSLMHVCSAVWLIAVVMGAL